MVGTPTAPTRADCYLGRRIKDARVAKGWTQDELGARVGLQKSAVAKYEKNQTPGMPVAVLLRFAVALDLPPTALLPCLQNEERRKQMQTYMQADVFTVDELAARWKCSRDVIYDMLRSKKLRGFRLGSSYRIGAVEVERYENGDA